MIKDFAKILDSIASEDNVLVATTINTGLWIIGSLLAGAVMKDNMENPPEPTLEEWILLFNVLYVIGAIGCFAITYFYTNTIDEPIEKDGGLREGRRYNSIRSMIKVGVFGYFGINFAVTASTLLVIIFGGTFSLMGRTIKAISQICDKFIDKILTEKEK